MKKKAKEVLSRGYRRLCVFICSLGWSIY